MKRRTLALLPALLLLLSLAACGAKGGDRMISTDSAPQAPREDSANGMLYEAGWDGGDYAPQPDAPMEGLPQGGALPENAKMIYTATLELESKEFDSAVQALDQLVEEMGGWFEVRRVNQGGSSRSLTGTVRVPRGRAPTWSAGRTPGTTSARPTTTTRPGWPRPAPSWSASRPCWPRRPPWRTLSPWRAP